MTPFPETALVPSVEGVTLPPELQDARTAVLAAAALEGGAHRVARVDLAHALQQSPRQVLVTIMRFWLQVAGREAKKKGKALRQPVLLAALDRAADAAFRSSPYYHARLSAVHIGMGGNPNPPGPPAGGAPETLEDVPYQVVITQDEARF